MAITQSAQKAHRQSVKRMEINVRTKENIKKLFKKLRVLISEKRVDEAKKLLFSVYKNLDKAAKVGLIKKNTATRKKSRLAKLISKS